MTQSDLFSNFSDENEVDEDDVDYLADMEEEKVEEFQKPSSTLSIKQLVFEALDHFKSQGTDVASNDAIQKVIKDKHHVDVKVGSISPYKALYKKERTPEVHTSKSKDPTSVSHPTFRIIKCSRDIEASFKYLMRKWSLDIEAVEPIVLAILDELKGEDDLKGL